MGIGKIFHPGAASGNSDVQYLLRGKCALYTPHNNSPLTLVSPMFTGAGTRGARKAYRTCSREHYNVIQILQLAPFWGYFNIYVPRGRYDGNGNSCPTGGGPPPDLGDIDANLEPEVGKGPAMSAGPNADSRLAQCGARKVPRILP